MKKLITVSCLFCLTSIYGFAQVPQSINFQGVARRTSGSVIANKTIALKLTILDSVSNGAKSPIRMEIQSQATNQFGSFNLQIGKNFISDSAIPFNQIPWASNYKLLKIDFDTTAALTFPNHLGTIQMVTVPYAFAAGIADSLNNFSIANPKDSEVIRYNAGTKKWEPFTLPNTVFQVRNNSSSWTSGSGGNWLSTSQPIITTIPADGYYYINAIGTFYAGPATMYGILGIFVNPTQYAEQNAPNLSASGQTNSTLFKL